MARAVLTASLVMGALTVGAGASLALGDKHKPVVRVVGAGQVKFCTRGLCAGPERWAQQSLRHARSAAALRRRLDDLRVQIRRLRTARRPQVHESAASYPAHYNEWLCIHSHEGAWDANTGNGYYGGLQMDFGFMQSYGPELLAAKGTADNWTPLEQMVVAERAYASRGFAPWPNTARMCGLL